MISPFHVLAFHGPRQRACRLCGGPIPYRDQFGISERVCRSCRGW